MFAGRIGAIIMSKRRNGQRRRRPSEEELDRLKEYDCTNLFKNNFVAERAIEDMDIRENTLNKLRFRKIPWPLWIMGSMFMMAGFFCIYMIQEDLLHFREWR